MFVSPAQVRGPWLNGRWRYGWTLSPDPPRIHRSGMYTSGFSKYSGIRSNRLLSKLTIVCNVKYMTLTSRHSLGWRDVTENAVKSVTWHIDYIPVNPLIPISAKSFRVNFIAQVFKSIKIGWCFSALWSGGAIEVLDQINYNWALIFEVIHLILSFLLTPAGIWYPPITTSLGDIRETPVLIGKNLKDKRRKRSFQGRSQVFYLGV